MDAVKAGLVAAAASLLASPALAGSGEMCEATGLRLALSPTQFVQDQPGQSRRSNAGSVTATGAAADAAANKPADAAASWLDDRATTRTKLDQETRKQGRIESSSVQRMDQVKPGELKQPQ